MGVEGGEVVDRLFELAVVLNDLMNRRLADNGLTPARGGIIWLLHHHGQLTQRELSQMLNCTPRNITGLVDALEEAGFVTRAAHPTDRRAFLVSLTNRGQKLAAGWGTDRHAGTAQLFAGATQTELATFAAVLDRVLNALRTANPGLSPFEG